FFFFQAEDGIRDFHVTGVQTCALPISPLPYISTLAIYCRPPVRAQAEYAALPLHASWRAGWPAEYLSGQSRQQSHGQYTSSSRSVGFHRIKTHVVFP